MLHWGGVAPLDALLGVASIKPPLDILMYHPVCVSTMDVSQVQSGSRCSSDFSIERILSEERRESNEAPSWLCCTRYQPPRIPRSVNIGCRARRSGRHARVPFTAAQASALEAAYLRAHYLAPPALQALAAGLQLRTDRIKIWFQNRRARERREKSSSISPPQAVTLPPTRLQGPMRLPNPWRPQHTPLLQHRVENVETFIPAHNGSYDDISDEDLTPHGGPESPIDVETVEE